MGPSVILKTYVTEYQMIKFQLKTLQKHFFYRTQTFLLE